MGRRNRNRNRERHVEARDIRHSRIDTALAHVSEDELYAQLESHRDPKALILILDEITDPHNLGACLRSANAAGTVALVTPKHHSVRVTETVQRIACGAAATTPVVAVANLARAMRKLQDLGFCLVGTDDSGKEMIYDINLTGPVAIVVGAEGKGLRRLTRDTCDHLARIPMLGSVECLNVSVATGVCLFEVVRQRRKTAKKTSG
ncbi:MAG: 23S rRNA (guanosine(2251)-2'-O)-methyltransferase RlmB [Phycisphaerae bacterium]|jgi:23S rRNA (guanosine2251-2'-O)-methyltransferase|nr:23S rRNA (guanosine(2251)-2'-O)-methyltransferase RlmB [Phycisphaerae bacterium]